MPAIPHIRCPETLVACLMRGLENDDRGGHAKQPGVTTFHGTDNQTVFESTAPKLTAVAFGRLYFFIFSPPIR